MHTHQRHKSSIMHLYAGYRVRDHQSPPFHMHRGAIRQQHEKSLDDAQSAIRLGDRQPKPVGCCRTRTDTPEFNQILRGKTDLLTTLMQRPQG